MLLIFTYRRYKHIAYLGQAGTANLGQTGTVNLYHAKTVIKCFKQLGSYKSY